DLPENGEIFMYDVLVGKTRQSFKKGTVITTSNIHHAASKFTIGERKLNSVQADTSKFESRSFNGFHRADGKVGTANYWLVVPMVFCENRNLETLRETLQEELGYAKPQKYKSFTRQLIEAYKNGGDLHAIELNETTIVNDKEQNH